LLVVIGFSGPLMFPVNEILLLSSIFSCTLRWMTPLFAARLELPLTSFVRPPISPFYVSTYAIFSVLCNDYLVNLSFKKFRPPISPLSSSTRCPQAHHFSFLVRLPPLPLLLHSLPPTTPCITPSQPPALVPPPPSSLTLTLPYPRIPYLHHPSLLPACLTPSLFLHLPPPTVGVLWARLFPTPEVTSSFLLLVWLFPRCFPFHNYLFPLLCFEIVNEFFPPSLPPKFPPPPFFAFMKPFSLSLHERGIECPLGLDNFLFPTRCEEISPI